jgi:zinc and cadmium transporter
MVLLQILLATLLISLISLVGVITFFVREKSLEKNLFLLISLSIGALMGGAFLHLIPEALEARDNVFSFVIVGFLSFFIIEKLFHWRHCHKSHCKVHSFAYINLLGDMIHNFIDGVIIAAAFLTGSLTGIISVFAIALHEIPQELGDFGVLVYAGFSKKKALLFNFLTALTALLGAIMGYFLLNSIENLMPYVLSIAAGGFIYIAASDLLPEVRKLESIKHTLLNFLMIILGISLMIVVGFLE